MSPRISMITLGVRDLEVATIFYEKGLGFPRKKSSPDKSYTNKLLSDKSLSVAKVKEEIGELIEAVEQNSNKI
ncbi:MAG: hypothetical protein VXY89_04125, partial [SAR324 cluster bacterium]|nr:hypothetical protein [SAR324 cluster bacterium]